MGTAGGGGGKKKNFSPGGPASHPWRCDLPQFLLPQSPLSDKPLPKLEFHSPLSLFHSLPLELKQDFAKRSPGRGTLRTTSSLDGQVQFYPGTPGGGTGRPESGAWPHGWSGPGPQRWAGPGAAGLSLGRCWCRLEFLDTAGVEPPGQARLPGPCRMPPT